ncbi:UL16-binding protein 2-like [Mustela erminea]|uniref:UL16-binding protein 2-like n=1 Tax=Mustela erminea TaxID=36723 RepID=UPI001387185F|nr:UL16-binding protein 2-like [Mustela erminea]
MRRPSGFIRGLWLSESCICAFSSVLRRFLCLSRIRPRVFSRVCHTCKKLKLGEFASPAGVRSLSAGDRRPPAQPARPSKRVLLPTGVPSEATPRLTWQPPPPRLGVAMEPTAATTLTGRSGLLFLLFLLRLLRGITAAPAGLVVGATRGGAGTDALSLSYNFSITPQARPGQPWCEIQGQVNGNEYLYYACGSKRVIPVGPWGMQLKDTAFWDTQREPLEDLGEELRKKLLDIRAEFVTKSDSLTLQVSLMCERGAHGHSRGSWRFVFTEQLTCLFDPENRKWIQFPPGGQQVKDMLDGDRELTELLMKIANGDCKRWLQKLREHSNETQEITGNYKTGWSAGPLEEIG